MLHFILHVSDLGLKRGSGTRQLRKKSSSQRVIDKMNVWSTSFGDSYQFSIPTIWTLALHFCKTFLGQWVNFTAVFKITASQRTPSCQDDQFVCRSFWPDTSVSDEKNTLLHHFVSIGQASIFPSCFCLLGCYVQVIIVLFLTFWPVRRKTWQS